MIYNGGVWSVLNLKFRPFSHSKTDIKLEGEDGIYFQFDILYKILESSNLYGSNFLFV